MKHKLFCFGLGYSAQYFIQELKHQNTGWAFSGTSRHVPKDPAPDIDYHVFDGTKPMEKAKDTLCDVTHMLISIPPQDKIGDPVLYHHKDLLTQLKNLKWVGYLSTTGVYGNRNGDWVYDNTAPAPTCPRGHQRLDAEQGWRTLCHDHNIPVHIFRLGSIYGPNKGPLANFDAHKTVKIVKEDQFFSRIHVADIAQTLIKSIEQPMAHPMASQSYNVVDDRPAAAHDVMDYICFLLGHPPLPAVDYKDAQMSPLMTMFYAENKRVNNQRIKQDLGVKLHYPTYKEGFMALAQSILRK